MLYRSVWVPSVASATLLVALRITDQLTPNDFALGLLLKSVEIFAFGLGVLGSLLFLFLVVLPDVPRARKLRAFIAVSLPYVVIAILWLMLKAAIFPRT